MSFNFIFMLTSNDRTVPDARQRLDEVLAGGARHIGFKDVGLPLDELKTLADEIRKSGGRSYLEVVSLDAESELRSARAAVELDVDCLLGGTRAEDVVPIIRSHPIRYFPFPGNIVGHPSVLEGTISEITNSARALTDLEGVHGLDLLAYRFAGDVPALMRSVCSAVEKPVVMAGSIDSAERVDAVADGRRCRVHRWHRGAQQRIPCRRRRPDCPGSIDPCNHTPCRPDLHGTAAHRCCCAQRPQRQCSPPGSAVTPRHWNATA